MTTIIAVVKDGQAAIAGDGQVTIGEMIMKHNAKKIRSLYDDQVLVGFAGAVADALTLFDKFENHLEQHRGNLRRAAVELAKEWRTDKFLRRLEAELLIVDPTQVLLLSGEGDVIEPDDHIAAIGSGMPYAMAAGKALYNHTAMSALEIAKTALEITASLCLFTNANITTLTISIPEESETANPEASETIETKEK